MGCRRTTFSAREGIDVELQEVVFFIRSLSRVRSRHYIQYSSSMRERYRAMTHCGQCLCGAIQFEATGTPNSVSICHCVDCRRSAGAPMVSWAEFPAVQVRVIKGVLKTLNSSGAAMRSFCGDCGSGIFYSNAELWPGIVDVQSATFNDADALPPTLQIQTAERLTWMKHLDELPAYERFPE